MSKQLKADFNTLIKNISLEVMQEKPIQVFSDISENLKESNKEMKKSVEALEQSIEEQNKILKFNSILSTLEKLKNHINEINQEHALKVEEHTKEINDKLKISIKKQQSKVKVLFAMVSIQLILIGILVVKTFIG